MHSLGARISFHQLQLRDLPSTHHQTLALTLTLSGPALQEGTHARSLCLRASQTIHYISDHLQDCLAMVMCQLVSTGGDTERAGAAGGTSIPPPIVP